MSDEWKRRIREELGGPEYRRLFAAVRERLERAGEGGARTVGLTGCTEEERRAIADLHGWRGLPGPEVRIHLLALDRALRETVVELGLREVLDALGGPLRDLPEARAEEAARLQKMWSEAEEQVAARPELRGWLEELRRLGFVSRAARELGTSKEDALERMLRVVAWLPAPGALLPVFAAELCGDAHALDAGRVMGSALLRAAARLAGWPEVPDSALARRQLLAEVGIACDALSADVLALGVRPCGGGLLARRLRDASDAGEPQRVTLRELPDRLELAGSPPVFVCENPSVVAAAADRLGARCPPLVCMEGVPSSAVLRLLRALREAGGRLLFHADFDWAGVRIAGALASQGLGEPWRYDAGDLQRAVDAGRRGPPLAGTPVDASWSPSLRETMARAGCSVLEEQVLDELLADLERAGAGGWGAMA